MELRHASPGSVLKRVLGYLRPHRVRFAGGVGLTAVGIALELVRPVPLAIVLDVVLGGRPLPRLLRPLLSPLGTEALLALAAASIVVVTVALGATTVGANYLTIDVGQRMVNDLRTEIYAHLQKLSLKFHYQQQTGDLLYRVMADTFSIQGMVMNGALPLVSAAIMLTGMFTVMVRYDVTLALVAISVAPLLYLAISRLSSRIHGHATASKEAESDLYSRAETIIGAVKLIQAYGREERAVAEFRKGSERSLALSLRLYSTETLFILIVDSVLALGTASLVWVGAHQVLTGKLTIGRPHDLPRLPEGHVPARPEHRPEPEGAVLGPGGTRPRLRRPRRPAGHPGRSRRPAAAVGRAARSASTT